MYRYQIVGSVSKKIYFDSESHATAFRWLHENYPTNSFRGHKKKILALEQMMPEVFIIKKVLPKKLILN